MRGSLVTVGIDVASQAAGTAACRLRWEGGSATIERVESELEEAASREGWIAVPLPGGLDRLIG